jgi:hypothetical protein
MFAQSVGFDQFARLSVKFRVAAVYLPHHHGACYPSTTGTDAVPLEQV